MDNTLTISQSNSSLRGPTCQCTSHRADLWMVDIGIKELLPELMTCLHC